MLRSMFSGLAGLSNHQTALDVIGNNVANVNTIGYKSSSIQFTELLNQTIQGASSPSTSGRGGTNPIQVGLGVGTSAVGVSHSQGNLQSTGDMSDLALQGNGFFILGDGSQTYYSRAGAFSFDSNGSMVHSSGVKVYGWIADVTGQIDKNSSIQALSIPVGQSVSANETTAIEYAYNLDATAYTSGTPVLSQGNSANVELVTGKFTGADDPLTTVVEPTIDDVIGSHALEVFAETHTGTNKSLNGTTTLLDLGIENIDSFRIVVAGTENTINLSNGTSSTINELVSAINAQIPGITVSLTNGSIKITQEIAGLREHVYVYDAGALDSDCLEGLASAVGADAGNISETQSSTLWAYLIANDFVDTDGTLLATATEIAALDLSNVGGVDFSDLETTTKILMEEASNEHITSSNGIAGQCFSSGADWIPGIKTIGTNSNLNYTDVLTGIDVTNDIVVTANGGTTHTFGVSAEGIAATSTTAELIAAFNTWAATEDVGEGSKFYMGLTESGKLFITYENADIKDALTVADSSPADDDGIIDTFFSTGGNWEAETAADINLARSSTDAYITHSYSEADGGGSYVFDVNFDAEDDGITGISGVDISAASDGFKTGRFVISTVPATEHITSTTVYDSLGNEHNITLSIIRTEDSSWAWTASGVGVSGGGSLVFDSNGALTEGANSGSITVGSQGGADALTITPDFTAVTQYADNSTMVHSSQDGYPNGSLSTYSISSDGTIIGIYSNGLNQNIGQIGIATFNNPSGLLKGSDGMFLSSNNSGEAQVGEANTGGRGSISAGTLEMSNVDIAEEFANMIIYQRGFQANSKIITTGDEMLQTLVNMKR